MASASYISDEDGSNKFYFPLDPLFVTPVTNVNKELIIFESAISYDGSGNVLPSYKYVVDPGTVTNGGELNISSDYISRSDANILFAKFLTGDTYKFYDHVATTTYTIKIKNIRFTPISGSLILSYSIDLVLL